MDKKSLRGLGKVKGEGEMRRKGGGMGGIGVRKATIFDYPTIICGVRSCKTVYTLYRTQPSQTLYLPLLKQGRYRQLGVGGGGGYRGLAHYPIEKYIINKSLIQKLSYLLFCYL